MQVTILSDDGTLLCLQLEGMISKDDFPDGIDPLPPLLEPIGGFARTVVINLDRTTFIDSGGISWMLGTDKQFHEQGGRVVFHSPPPLVNHVLEVSRLPLILHFATDEAAARRLALEGRAS
jgi:anti-anti-sigma factor